MADTGIIREQGTKRQDYKDRDTCGALVKGRLPTNDWSTIFCSPLLVPRKKNQNTERTREMQRQQQRSVSSKDFAEPAQFHFCEGQ